MSRFGDRTFKQEIHDSLHWIINDFKPEVFDEKEQLLFLHQNIMYLINGEIDKLNPFIGEWGMKRGYSNRKILKELGEMYQVMTENDFKIE